MAKTSKFPVVAFGLFFALPGLGMLAGMYAAIVTGPDTDRMLKTEGEVIGVPGGTPRVAFTDNDGRVHEFSGSVSSDPPSYDIGEKVDVLYDPARPEEAIIDSFLERYFLILMLGGMGGVFTLVGGGTVLGALRARMRDRTPAARVRTHASASTSAGVATTADASQIESIDRSAIVRMIRMGAFQDAERYAQKEAGLTARGARRLVKEIRKQEGR